MHETISVVERGGKGKFSFSATLLNTIPSPVFYKDCNGRYLGCNKAFEAFFGVTRDWLIGKTVYDLQPLYIADEYRRDDEALLKEPGISVYEGKVKPTYSKEVRNVIIRKATFLNEAGELGGVVGVLMDVTDKANIAKALQDSETRFRRITEQMNVMIVEIGVDGIRTYASPSHRAITGYTPDDLVGKHCLSHIHPDDEERTSALFHDCLMMCKPGLIECRHLTAGGGLIWIEASGTPLTNELGELVGAVIVSRDITCKVKEREARRKAEKDLVMMYETAQSDLEDLNRLTDEKAKKFNASLKATITKMRERRLARAGSGNPENGNRPSAGSATANTGKVFAFGGRS